MFLYIPEVYVAIRVTCRKDLNMSAIVNEGLCAVNVVLVLCGLQLALGTVSGFLLIVEHRSRFESALTNFRVYDLINTIVKATFVLPFIAVPLEDQWSIIVSTTDVCCLTDEAAIQDGVALVDNFNRFRF